MALFWNRHVQNDKSEGFFEAAQEIYERETPGIVKPETIKGSPSRRGLGQGGGRR
jgi:hypothetical protein